MADLRSRRTALKALYSDESDTRRYVVEGFVYFGLIHAQLALVLVGWLPSWSLPLGLPVWMARMMIGRHELIHVRKEGEVDLFNRMWPVLAMVTPLSAGYREYRILHQRHHQFTLTRADPDLYQIRGGMLSGWLQCFTSPEQTLVRWVAERGVDCRLAGEVLVRAAFFFSMAALCQETFLWYWVPLRITYGTALFFFSYVLQLAAARYGTFRIELGPVGVRLFCLLFGKGGWLAVCNHDVHHVNGNLSPLRFGEARQILERNAR